MEAIIVDLENDYNVCDEWDEYAYCSREIRECTTDEKINIFAHG